MWCSLAFSEGHSHPGQVHWEPPCVRGPDYHGVRISGCHVVANVQRWILSCNVNVTPVHTLPALPSFFPSFCGSRIEHKTFAPATTPTLLFYFLLWNRVLLKSLNFTKFPRLISLWVSCLSLPDCRHVIPHQALSLFFFMWAIHKKNIYNIYVCIYMIYMVCDTYYLCIVKIQNSNIKEILQR